MEEDGSESSSEPKWSVQIAWKGLFDETHGAKTPDPEYSKQICNALSSRTVSASSVCFPALAPVLASLPDAPEAYPNSTRNVVRCGLSRCYSVDRSELRVDGVRYWIDTSLVSLSLLG